MQTILMPKAASSGAAETSPFVKLKTSRGPGGEAGGNISIHGVTDATLDGTWTVLGSNKPDADVNGDTEAVDISAAFKDAGNNAIATVAHGTAATQKQGWQAGPIWFGAIAIKFTPSGGAGNRSAYLNEAV